MGHSTYEDIMKVILIFQKYDELPKGTNASFICLVPKLENPHRLEEYRPISLVGCVHKII